ncbi:tape measure protein, partial [Enterobacter hormaechei subsp. hoffmannii]
MASNATFEVEIYGNTTKFENSLKGVNTAMSGLRGEAKNLREALKLDPTNTGKMAQLQKNLQTQLGLSRDKATKLKEELSTVDKGTSAGQKKWLQLTRDLGTVETQANRLEGEIKQVEGAISSGSWNIDAKMDTKGVNSGIEGMKSRFSGLREIAVGAFRQIGASAVSAVGNGLKDWVSNAMDTQKAMISLQNTMKFKGNGKDFDYVSKSMQNLAKDTNANTEDTLKLSTTFIGLGDSAKKAVSKTEALVKANQAFGGTGENLKGVVQSYGQMSAAGKVTAENIGQLTDNNTALGSSLKDTVMKMNPSLQQYGSFNDAVSKGAVSMDMLNKAMEKMAKGSGGGIKTIGDAWDSFNETMSIALVPTLNALTPIISGLIDQMSDWGESAGKAVTNVVKYFQDLFQKLQENAATLAFLEAWDSIKSAFGSIVSIIGNVINSFIGINTETTKNATSIDNVAKSIAVFAGK